MTDFQIKCFLAVASTLSFTEAAHQLFVSQPNVSRQINLLEEELNLTLFHRSTKSVKLTPAGTILYDKLQALTKEWEYALTQARKVANKLQGHLTIGCVPWEISNSILTQLLISFQTDNPNISVRKERNRQNLLIEGLKSGYYDAILITEHDIFGMNNTIEQTIYFNPLCILIHRDHELFDTNDLELSDLASADFLRYNPCSVPIEKDYLFKVCKTYGFYPNIVSEYKDFEEFLYAAEAGKGVSVICEETAILSNPYLKLVPIISSAFKGMPMKLVCDKNNPNKELIELFKFAIKSWHCVVLTS
ncbi:MAG: LysR family transcriptional regulator [Clostridiales bacterium]|nr:LysR family transcriptional regulator [Clostridiales bacterium]